MTYHTAFNGTSGALTGIDRRRFALGGLALGSSAFFLSACGAAAPATTPRTETKLDRKTDVMSVTPETDIDWANLTRGDWQDRLTEEEFYVLRREGTERPFTSPLNDEKRSGTYVCAGCSLPLFKSDTKFDSGTGWPSFFDHIDGAVETKRDFKLVVPRTEYHCSRCGGHQGHVFKDGPRPTGLRYCNNGVALDFIPDEA
ncbi:MAG: peptide-methionine (R)-S-oxide reductase MsrB [Litorimonas sp.]